MFQKGEKSIWCMLDKPTLEIWLLHKEKGKIMKWNGEKRPMQSVHYGTYEEFHHKTGYIHFGQFEIFEI